MALGFWDSWLGVWDLGVFSVRLSRFRELLMTGLIFADSPDFSPKHGALHKKDILQGPRQFPIRLFRIHCMIVQ